MSADLGAGEVPAAAPLYQACRIGEAGRLSYSQGPPRAEYGTGGKQTLWLGRQGPFDNVLGHLAPLGIDTRSASTHLLSATGIT